MLLHCAPANDPGHISQVKKTKRSEKGKHVKRFNTVRPGGGDALFRVADGAACVVGPQVAPFRSVVEREIPAQSIPPLNVDDVAGHHRVP